MAKYTKEKLARDFFAGYREGEREGEIAPWDGMPQNRDPATGWSTMDHFTGEGKGRAWGQTIS